MQGLVTIDFGNSHPHAGLFLREQQEWKLIKVVPWKDLPIYLSQLEMTPHNSQFVLSEVKVRDEELLQFVKQGFLVTRVKDYWKGVKFAGMPVDYAKTLGEDRLIESYYCYKQFKTPLLLIDAGTFSTMDVITTQGFLGGYIFPNFENYIESFKHGENLKSVTLNHELSVELPHTTPMAMQDSYSAFVALATQLIEQHNLQKVVLTGGQSVIWKSFLDKKLNDVPVDFLPHLIHSSLHYWMTTQIEII